MRFLILSLYMHGIVAYAIYNFFNLPKKELKELNIPLILDIKTIQIIEPLQEISSHDEPQIIYVERKIKAKQLMKKNSEKEIKKPTLEHMIVQQPSSMVEKKATEESLHVKIQTDFKDSILQQIQEVIAKHKQYPKRAQRGGMEGEIIISFTWSAKGVDALKIIKPSAHSVLNEYTLELIKTASKEFPEVSELIEITLPIGFNLL